MISPSFYPKKKVGRLPKLANKILDATKNIKILIFFSKLDPFFQFHRQVLKKLDKNAERQLLFFLTQVNIENSVSDIIFLVALLLRRLGKQIDCKRFDQLQFRWGCSLNDFLMIKFWSFGDHEGKFQHKRSLTHRQGRICRETAREEPKMFSVLI